MSKYSKLDATDNIDFGSTTTPVEDDDDIFITPDHQDEAPVPPPKLTQVDPAPVASSGFNFSSFITPQMPDFVQIETRERPFTGGNTLDESVLTTLHRDLATIGDKVFSILWPMRLKHSLMAVRKLSGLDRNNDDVEDTAAVNGDDEDYSSDTMRKIRDWDLWGPLVINLLLSLVITYMQSRSLNSGEHNSSATFSAAFTLIWASLAVLAVNIQLLTPVPQKLENGGVSDGVVGLSFFQCVSLLSYAMFPVLLGGILSAFIPFRFVKMLVNIAMLAWSLLCTWLIVAIVSNCKRKGSLSFVSTGEDGNDADKRIFLMVYPVFLVFGLFSWFFVIV